MIPRRLAIILLLVATSALPGCNSPTEPSPKYTLRAVGTVASVAGSPTLLGYSVSIDGRNIYGPYSFTTPVSQSNFTADTEGSHGHHTLTIRIDKQTQVRTDYSVSDVRVILSDSFFPSLHEIAGVSLPAQSASVTEGQSFVFAFDI
jgi:hypothetical protein